MLKRIISAFIIVLACISGFAYHRYYEQEHVGFSPDVILAKWNKAKPDFTLLHSGDLIFRHGRGAISNMLMALSKREAKYSHAGIIHVENRNVFVYHAIGGEENISNRMRKDPIGVFCNPNDVHAFGIYRLDLDESQLRQVDSLADRYYREGLEFDTQFDLSTDDKMYCSEFVYKIITRVSRNENYLSLSSVSGISYVACDDLYLNVHSRFVYAYQY